MSISPKLKKIILARDGNICKNCGTKDDLQIDHIKPFSKGGTDDINNLQVLCRKCNHKKSNEYNGNRTRICNVDKIKKIMSLLNKCIDENHGLTFSEISKKTGIHFVTVQSIVEEIFLINNLIRLYKYNIEIVKSPSISVVRKKKSVEGHLLDNMNILEVKMKEAFNKLKREIEN